MTFDNLTIRLVIRELSIKDNINIGIPILLQVGPVCVEMHVLKGFSDA